MLPQKKGDTVAIRTPSTAVVTNSKTEYASIFSAVHASMFTVYKSMPAFNRTNRWV